MTVHLPIELESSLQAVVDSGRFASLDEAMAQAARLLLDEMSGQQATSTASGTNPDLFLGSMREAADELDKIVADAYRRRQTDTWRELAVE